MMTTISDRDHAEAQAMAEAFHGGTLAALHDDIVRRWLAVRDRVLAAHECQPAWRPTTADEIQVGWEVRSRRGNRMEGRWGIAHHRDVDGGWRTEANTILTHANMGWTYETTAPLPEPKPDPAIRLLLDWYDSRVQPTEADARLLLTSIDAARGAES